MSTPPDSPSKAQSIRRSLRTRSLLRRLLPHPGHKRTPSILALTLPGLIRIFIRCIPLHILSALVGPTPFHIRRDPSVLWRDRDWEFCCFATPPGFGHRVLVRVARDAISEAVRGLGGLVALDYTLGAGVRGGEEGREELLRAPLNVPLVSPAAAVTGEE